VRAARLVAALAVLAATVAGPAGGTAAAQEPDPRESVVRVDVRAMTTALVPDVTEKLVVRSRAVNTSGEPIPRLRVGLRFGQALRGRFAISSGGSPARFGTRVGDHEVDDGELAPNGTADVNFDVEVRDLPFRRATAPGVYPMRIEVRSRFQVVGAVDTYVVWWPQRSPRLRIAWVWPLVEPSHRGIGDDFYDDDLAAQVDGGRLDTLLTAGATKDVPVSWAVDPALLDDLRRMAGTYTVRGKEGTGGQAAKAWLDRARTTLRGSTVLPLPYADQDLATTAPGPLAADAVTAFRLSRDVLRRELGTAGDTRLAWPIGTVLDPAVESLLAGQGVKGVVLPSAALPLARPLYYTPTASAPLASGTLGDMTALLSEPLLDGVVANPGPEGPRLSVQRIVADTAMIALERPSELRDVVVTPPRSWAPVREFATQLLEQTKQAPWLQPVGLESVLARAPSAEPRTRAAGTGAVLPAEQVRRVTDQRRRIQRVRGILTDPGRGPGDLPELDDALLRALSGTLGGDPRGQRLTASVDGVLDAELGKLRVVSGGLITMTGREGRIPLTFQNDLGQAVRVRIRISSAGRLELDEGSAYERGQEVVIQPGVSPLPINGKATTGGLFRVRVDVLGNDGAPLGIRTDLRVRSTAYGAVALAITGGAFGLLLVGSATRLVQRRRRGRRDPDPEPVAA
jgi:hypothetical protein